MIGRADETKDMGLVHENLSIYGTAGWGGRDEAIQPCRSCVDGEVGPSEMMAWVSLVVVMTTTTRVKAKD